MTSIITVMHGEKEFIPLIIHNYKNFNDFDSLELVIVDDGPENLLEYFIELDNVLYLYLDDKEKEKFIDDIINKYENSDTSYLLYEKKRNRLPNGFLRDYGCGMSSHDNIFHMNIDCIYNPKSINRKKKFLENNKAECIFNDTVLAYDIYGKQLYKSESPIKIYESTLYHTREFWKRRGFKWSDTQYEGKYFHHNNGVDRKMDNYYDTIQLLSIHNINLYKPIKISLENMNINIPDLISDIEIKQHPFEKIINDIYKDNVIILGLESEYLDNIDNDWDITNIKEKWKQTKITKLVKDYKKSFNIFLHNSKYPVWDLFKNVSFDIIILETHKNYEQMQHIIQNNKNCEYLYINGIYISKDFLNKK